MKDINGESHYILEDGSRMKTEIAGERVNPAWGITKAGKPRKRLAQACVACREKKVKCEPANDPREPKCGQCSRLGRVCKKPKEVALEGDFSDDAMPQSIRDQTLATTTSSMSLSDHSTSTSGATVVDNGGTYMTPNGFSQSGTIVTVNDRERPGDVFLKKNRPPAIPAPAPNTDHTAKKRGHGPDHYQDLKENPNAPPAVKRRKAPTGAAKVQSYSGPEAPEHVNIDEFEWNVDPFVVDPEATMYFVELMFYHRASGAYTFLPKDLYKDWVRYNREKSPDDRMALYAFMALGAQFSQEKHAKAAADKLGQIATDAETDRSGNFSLQLAHTRITLLLYHFSRAQWGLAFEFTASTSMAVKALQWHQEEHVRNVNDDHLFHEYGLTATQLMECRRRTFWLVYMIDVSLWPFHLHPLTATMN